MPKETIGPRIKAFRKWRGITQAELAKSLGYSHKSVITHIEKGESEMSYEKILLLLRTYDDGKISERGSLRSQPTRVL